MQNSREEIFTNTAFIDNIHKVKETLTKVVIFLALAGPSVLFLSYHYRIIRLGNAFEFEDCSLKCLNSYVL